MRSDPLDHYASYLGVDLTDRYATQPRAIDVCGLSSNRNGTLDANFWQWYWPENAALPLDAAAIIPQILQAEAVMIDGPQGLAAIGQTRRECERITEAAGQTPDYLPEAGQFPFAGYIRSSIELFQALANQNLPIGRQGVTTGVWEVYPGNCWARLAGQWLPNKSTQIGRECRKRILETCGVQGLPELPTHDQNDACLAALIAAAANGQVQGLTTELVGNDLIVEENGHLREGQMVVPKPTSALRIAITDALNIDPANLPVIVPVTGGNPQVLQRANELLDKLIQKLKQGEPYICSYKWAYKHLYQVEIANYLPSHTRCVLVAALETTPQNIEGFGYVSLDSFIVRRDTRLPGDLHFETADYEQEDWELVFGNATLLEGHMDL